ncbi:MAG: hypothetical protein PQJ44_05200, partial [Sphaerochaetaceae bacterium]|nr:hypothetical protein [Sphaerochaetaceae bacterium]
MLNVDRFKRIMIIRFSSLLLHNFVYCFVCFLGLIFIIFIDESFLRDRLYFNVFWDLTSLVLFGISTLSAILLSIASYFKNKRFQYDDYSFVLVKKNKRIITQFTDVTCISSNRYTNLFFSTNIVTLRVVYLHRNRKRV